MRYIISLLCIFIINSVQAQSLYQTVRGTTMDAATQLPIPFVEITCFCNGKNIKTISDTNGYFRLENVEVGRQSFLFTRTGYTDRAISNLDISAGKEMVLQVVMEEKIEQINEAVISIKKTPKETPLNTMATVSSRQFNVEETQRFAAAVNDPARMAMGFAGVTAPDDGNNMIVIRGNSPNGLIWRMEGMDIPNPNHFSNVGTSGGGITILSSQLLANSDFFTGAFPAEYGNGLSGVFDLKLRKGNNEKKEHTVQFGLLGLDVATEGPLGKKGGSYLVNYRYSTLSMISALGIELGDAVTKFQDLSYNVQLPLNKKLALSVFGFTGLSNQKAVATLDTNVWRTEPWRAVEWNFFANSIFGGTKLSYTQSKRHIIDLKLGVGITQNGYDETEFNKEFVGQIIYLEKYAQIRNTLSVQSNFKADNKNLIRSGVIVNHVMFDFRNDARDFKKVLRNIISADGSTQTFQAYTQWQHKAGTRLILNPGIHAVYLALNNTYSIEPRFGAKYQLSAKNWLSAGAGMHSQMHPLGTYFYKSPDGHLVNKSMELSKAIHYVLGYDQLLGKAWHVKSEIYLQQLRNLAVSPEPGNPYCTINSLDGFSSDTLVSKGKGQNYGAEITIEKFFTGSTYVLLTASISDSKYTDAHARKFNTRFNVGRTVSLLAGKEWTIGNNRLGLNFKTMWIGGMRDIPINMEASRQEKMTIRDYSRIYEIQNPDYFRIDTKISYKINKKNHSSTWSLDIQNTTNRKNVWGSYYNPNSDKIEYSTQSPLIPVLAYKLEF